VFADRAPGGANEKGALSQLYRVGVSFELVASRLEDKP
jgi:4-hydroxyphenylpyruvate dioxygenase